MSDPLASYPSATSPSLPPPAPTPPPAPPSPVAATAPPRPESPLWWIGAHGGAGVSTLARLTGVGVDGGRSLPGPEAAVVVCCRASAAATTQTGPLLGRWVDAAAALPRLLGVVVVAAAPGPRRPALVREHLRAWQAWGLTVWQVPWYADLLAVHDPAQLGPPPAIEALAQHLHQLTAAAVTR